MRKLSKLLALVIATIIASALIDIVIDYLEAESARYYEAVMIVRRDALKHIMDASAEGNVYKMAYYRWRYNNVDKVIADDGGATNIILDSKKQKSH